MALSEQRRQQLDGIVRQMIQNKESDGDVQLVVNDFVQKYQSETVPAATKPRGDLLRRATDVVTSIFPGGKVGEAIGTLGGLAVEKAKGLMGGQDNSKFYDTSAPSPLQVTGDIAAGAALVGGVKLPPAKTILGAAGQLGALGAVSGAGGAAASGGGTGDIIKSAILSGTIGAALGAGTKVAGKAVTALTKKAPAKIYNTTIKTSLPDTKAAVRYGGKTLGDDLVERGVTGSDKQLFKKAATAIQENETKLQGILSKSKQTISRDEIAPYLDDLISKKGATPGLAADVETVKAILNEYPKQIPIAKANEIKRNLYNALTDTAFRLDPSLTTKREAMKAIAKGIKTEIENKTATEVGTGVVKGINKELAVFGKLQDRALDKIARVNKNNLLGLGDMFALGSGAALGAATGGSSIVGAAFVEGLKRALGNTAVMTRGAVVLDRLGKYLDKLPTDEAGKISKAALIQLLNEVNRSQK